MSRCAVAAAVPQYDCKGHDENCPCNMHVVSDCDMRNSRMHSSGGGVSPVTTLGAGSWGLVRLKQSGSKCLEARGVNAYHSYGRCFTFTLLHLLCAGLLCCSNIIVVSNVVVDLSEGYGSCSAGGSRSITCRSSCNDTYGPPQSQPVAPPTNVVQ